ncbi:MAG: DNA gyrase subunit A [Christensenellales bacterium]
MAKKRDYSAEYDKIVDNTRYVDVEINDEMKKSFIAYAMAVNVSRAIPDVRDGLKPVHRRILYSMGELGLFNDKPHRKCARIVGDVLGKYHPHGDSAVYSSLVRLAQDFSIRYTLVDGHGNFGSVDGDSPAAQRYTEARLSKIAGEMLRDIDKETVDFYPNFDETLQQPRVLPSRFPNLLVNGSDGIAVGMATNIPPHNLNEVCNAIVAQIENPEITVDELMNYIPAPDYPTGGLIMGRSAIRQAYKTGRGGIVVRARTEIEEEENGRSKIIITEIPYQVNKAELIMSMANLVKNKKIEGIADIKEESDRQGMRIVIDVKKDYQANVILNTLYKHTALQSSYGIIFLALVNNEPKILNLKEMLAYYIEHQKDVITRRTKYDLTRAEEREHIVRGLVIALANIDEVIRIIKASSDKVVASEQLQKNFELSDKQANAILEMRLQRLTSLEVEKLNEELDQLVKTIVELKSILESDEKIKEIIKTELIEIRDKYGDERRSEIVTDFNEIDIADLIEKEDVVVSMTHYGYIKRVPVSEYKAQKRGGKGIIAHKPKEEDFVENMFITNTHNDILFFTNFGKVYSIKGYEIPEGQKSAKGRAIVNLLELAENEKVTAVIPITDDMEGNLIQATKKGIVKKTALSEYKKIRKVGKIAISLDKGDELISVQVTSGRDEILLATHEGKCIKFSEEEVRTLSRDTRGVRSIKLEGKDYVVDMIAIKPNHTILTISENGYGKRSDPEEYRLQTRGGKGVKAGIFNQKTGKLVNMKQVTEDEDIMLIASNGIIIRTKAKYINVIGRGTVGVRIMKLKDDNTVVCVAIADGYAEDVSGDDIDDSMAISEEEI